MAQGSALVLFTLAPRADAARKDFGPTTAGGAGERFVAELIRRTVEVLEASGSGEVLLCAPAGGGLPETGRTVLPQRGADFGHRFTAALEDAFACGHDQVVIVGNDSPELSPARVRAAVAHLNEDPARAVLGPTPDGGFYLLAISRRCFETIGPDRFSRLPWCGRETLPALEAELAALRIPALRLDPMRDLDRVADVESWLRQQAARGERRGACALARLALAFLSRSTTPAFGRPLAVRVHASFRAAAAARAPPPLLRA